MELLEPAMNIIDHFLSYFLSSWRNKELELHYEESRARMVSTNKRNFYNCTSVHHVEINAPITHDGSSTTVQSGSSDPPLETSDEVWNKLQELKNSFHNGIESLRERVKVEPTAQAESPRGSSQACRLTSKDLDEIEEKIKSFKSFEPQCRM